MENFTTYTEVDTNGHIAKTADRVTWTGLRRDESAYLYKDKAGYFDGDFIHHLDVKLTASVASAVSSPWMVSTGLNDLYTLVLDAGEDTTALWFYYTSSEYRLYLQAWGQDSGSDYAVIALNTVYYLLISRDDNGGASSKGQVICKIYTVKSDRDGDTENNLLDTISIDFGEQADYRYIYAVSSYNTDNVNTQSGYTENLNIGKAVKVINETLNLSEVSIIPRKLIRIIGKLLRVWGA